MKNLKRNLCLLALLGLGFLLAAGLLSVFGKTKRGNTECSTDERVFDYADVLTDEEEDRLQSLIEATQPKIGCDIVLVTICDSSLASDAAMMQYADDFYDEGGFGWNQAQGDGALYLDNWGRDQEGAAYSWLSTCGTVERTYTSEKISRLVDRVCEKVNEDPYAAYVSYVKNLKKDMTPGLSPLLCLVLGAAAGLVAALLFLCINLPSKEGETTVGKQTYVKQEDVHMLAKEDTFLSKNVTHVRIQTNQGGGGGSAGGGHHVSGGGVSHGGGGGRH